MTLYRIDPPSNRNRREFLSKHPRLYLRTVSFVHLSAMVRLGMVVGAVPDWLVEPSRLGADAADLDDTQNDARYGGCQ